MWGLSIPQPRQACRPGIHEMRVTCEAETDSERCITCEPPTPFSHFWYRSAVALRFSAWTRSFSFKDWRTARAVI